MCCVKYIKKQDFQVAVPPPFCLAVAFAFVVLLFA